MNKSLISILVPCYNVEAYLPKCLDTIIGQTYQNLQVVLIDDGSKDGTWKVMQEYAAKDSRLEIYHQENQGVSPTRNHLLEKVKGDYVLFVDSDDWIELDMVESMVTLANDHNSPFIMCDRVINDTTPSTSQQCLNVLSQEQAIHDFLRHEYFVGSLWNKLVKSSLLHNLKFHCGIWYGEDALFCWNILQKTQSVVVTNKQFYHYRMNDESISHISFGAKKISGYNTWQIITEEASKKWPQYSELALAHRAVNAMHLLRDASHSGYKQDETTKLLQKTLRNNIKYMWKNKSVKFVWYPYALLISLYYPFGKLY